MKVHLRQLVLAIFMVGCSSSTNSTGSAGGAPIPIDGLHTELARAKCERLFRCCDETKLFMSKPDATRADCETMIVAEIKEDIDEIRPAIDSGKLSYDAAAARTCVAAMASLPCDSPNPPPCDAVTRSTVANGAACEHNYLCASGYCTSAKVCGQRPVVGAACDGFACADGAYCDRTTFKCLARKANDARCDSSEECASDYCDYRTSSCIGKKPNGEPCVGGDGCLSGYCDSTTQNCAPYLDGLCYAR